MCVREGGLKKIRGRNGVKRAWYNRERQKANVMAEGAKVSHVL